MSNFPLYYSLINEKNRDVLTFAQKEEFINIIKTLDNNGHELIYALIRTYQLENSEDKSTFKLPFGGKYVKNDMKFDLNDLPDILQIMLYKFVVIHEKSLAEEKLLEKNRISSEIVISDAPKKSPTEKKVKKKKEAATF